MEGCTDAEVSRLEAALGTTLPATYRDFLKHLGKRAGSFLEGSDLTYAWLRDLTNQARAFAKEEGVALPEDAFAFLGHQGYQFLFFVTGTGDDPTVYGCFEGEGIREVSPRFSDWLLGAIDDELEQA